MTHAPDLLLLSMYDPVMGEVAAFEELIGSHGGLGGPQTQPFILHPAEWTLDEEVPLGAPAIYRNIRRWLESIGIRLGKAPRPPRPPKGCGRTGGCDLMPADDRDQAASPAPIVRRAPGRVPVGRAWNNFIVHPASVRRAIRVIIAAYVTAMLLGGLVIWLVDPRLSRHLAGLLVRAPDHHHGRLRGRHADRSDRQGRGAVIMLVSIATLSILTAFITSAFVEARQAERRAQTDADEAAQRAHRGQAQRPGGAARAHRTAGRRPS